MDQRTRFSSVAALGGVIQPIWFLGGSIVFGAARDGYDATHAISELGQQGAPNAVAWNVMGFAVSGALYLAFATAIAAGLGSGWLYRLTVAQAFFLAAGGLFSCDPGCPPVMSTWQGWAHTVVGLTYFAITSAIPIVAWRTFRRRQEWRDLVPMTVIVAVIVIALFISGPFIFGAEHVGWYQRLTLAIAGIWSVLVALRLRAAGRYSPTLAPLPAAR